MKLKSILATIPISFLVLVLVFVFTASEAAQITAGGPESEKPEADKQTATSPPDADYWFDKGALCATYGNDRAAIKYFQKAVSLDSNRSGAYFELGISYGQLGNFDQAITLVNKAIEMEPQNGLYLYGRGRVYLLAGKEDQAMQDFKKAADLNDEDAQTYLRHVAQRSN
jgi:tetratricopeptide (TPR) repeat protein